MRLGKALATGVVEERVVDGPVREAEPVEVGGQVPEVPGVPGARVVRGGGERAVGSGVVRR